MHWFFVLPKLDATQLLVVPGSSVAAVNKEVKQVPYSSSTEDIIAALNHEVHSSLKWWNPWQSSVNSLVTCHSCCILQTVSCPVQQHKWAQLTGPQFVKLSHLNLVPSTWRKFPPTKETGYTVGVDLLLLLLTDHSYTPYLLVDTFDNNAKKHHTHLVQLLSIVKNYTPWSHDTPSPKQTAHPCTKT